MIARLLVSALAFGAALLSSQLSAQNRCFGVSPAPSGVYDVQFGIANTFIFNTNPPWSGATDGDNCHEFFATEPGGFLWRIDPALNTWTPVGGGYGGPIIRELGYDEANDVLYGTNHNALFTIDTTTGLAAFVGIMVDVAGGAPGGFWAMDYHAGLGTLYAVSNNTNSLYSVNTATGQVTLIGPAMAAQISDIWYDSLSGTLFAVSGAGGGDSHYWVDTATGMHNFMGGGYGGDLRGLGHFCCLVRADARPYCGTGFNIPCDGFVVTSPPTMGGVFSATVAHPCGGVGAVLVAYSAPASVMTAWGELLVDVLSPPVFGPLIGVGNPTNFAIPVPPDCRFCGITFYTQALSFMPMGSLHCAWDCIVGC